MTGMIDIIHVITQTDTVHTRAGVDMIRMIEANIVTHVTARTIVAHAIEIGGIIRMIKASGIIRTIRKVITNPRNEANDTTC